MPYFFHNPLLFLQLKYQNQNKLTDRHFGLSLHVNLKKKKKKSQLYQRLLTDMWNYFKHFFLNENPSMKMPLSGVSRRLTVCLTFSKEDKKISAPIISVCKTFQ